MLVLNRKIGESFTIDGDIKIIILSNHGIVRLGIDAPKYKRIIRDDSSISKNTQLDRTNLYH